MADEIDRAQNEVERSLGEALRVRRPVGPSSTGRCLYCDNLLDRGRRWCDSICRDDWEADHAK